MSNQDFNTDETGPPVDFAARRAQVLVTTGADANPDEAARANELASATGMSPSAAYENRENLEPQVKARMAADIVSNNNYLQDYVNSHPLAAKVSNDDYGQLDTVSQAVDKVGGGGILTEALKGFKENADLGGLAEEHEKLANYLASNPLFGNAFIRQVTDAAVTTPALAMRLASGVIGGAAAAVGEAYKQMGADKAVPYLVGGLLGDREEAYSRMSPEALTRDLITYAQVGLSGQAGLHGPVAPEVSAAIGEAARVAKAVEPYVASGKEPPVGVHPVLDQIKAEQATTDAANLSDALKESVASATRERSPEMFTSYIRGITDGNIGISADAVRALYGDKVPAPDDGLLGFVPDLTAQLGRAEATGGDIQVPLAQWLGKVEPDVAKELADHIRARPEGMTVEEAKEQPETPEPQPTTAPQSQAEFAEHFPFEHEPLQPNDERIQNILDNIGTLTNELKRQYPKLSQQLGGIRDYFRVANDNGVDVHEAIEKLGDTLDFVQKNGGHTEVTSRLSGMLDDLESLSDDSVEQQIKHQGDISGLHRSYKEHFDTFVNPKPGTGGASMPLGQTISGLKAHLGKLTRTTDLNEAEGKNGLGDKVLVAERLATEDAIKALEAKQPAVDTIRQAAGLQGIQERKLALQRLETAELPSGNVHHFSINDPTGSPMGDIFISDEKGGKQLYIEDITSPNGPQSLGPRAMRDLLEQVKEQFPDAESIMGMRVSGGREKANKENVKASIDLTKIKPRAKALPEASLEDKQAFEKAAAIGMTVKQHALYQKLIERRATEDAEAANARAVADQRRTQTAEWKANRAELRPQVKADVEGRPEVELDEMLRGGKVKLNPEGLTDDQKALLPKSFVSADGIHPADLAGLFGDTQPAALVDRLVALTRSREQAGMKPAAHLSRMVDVETDRQMEAKYGSLDRNVLEEAKDQVLSQTQEDLLHEETMARAAEAGLAYPITKDELKGALQEFFNKQLVRDVSSDKGLAEAGRAGRATEMALLKGDYAEAFRQKQRQYNAIVMANMAKKFEKAQGQFEKLAKRFSSREVAGVEQEYTNWVHDILGKVGQQVKRSVGDLQEALARGEQKTLSDFVDYKELHDMREVPVAEFLQDPAFKKRTEDLTTAEFSAVHDSVKALAKNGRDELKLIKAGEEFDLDEKKREMISQLQTFKEKHYDAVGGRPLGPLPPSVARPLRTYLVSHLQLESIFNRWDRGDSRGVFTQFIARELATAANSEAALEREFSTKLRGLADKADLKERVPNELFKDPLGGSSIPMMRKNLRAILLNVGNKSNFEKLARGYMGTVEKGEAGKAQVGAFQAQVMDWLHTNASKQDWDWGQGIWDTFAGIKKQSDTMYRSLTGGVEPENIPFQPIATPHGEYPGGYYPVIYHPVWEGASKKLMGGDPLEQVNYNRATTPAGYTKARTGYAAPLALDLDMMPVRMRQMLHDIAFRPAVIQAGKIFYDKDVRAAITKYYGKEYRDMLVPYLRDVANAANYRNDAQQVFTRFSEHVRQNIIATLIGLNPGTVLKHGPTAAINSISEVGVAPFLKAMKGLFSINEDTGETNWAFAMKTSEELQRRQRFYRETLGGATEEIQGETSLRDNVIALGAKPVAMSDLLSATPTWMAKYSAEMADHGVHGDAVFEADRAVRRAHGSSVITNRPQVMRTGPMGSWLVSLYGFFSHIMNRQYEMAWRAGDTLDLVKQGDYAKAMAEVPKLSGMLFSYVIAPAVIEELVTPMQDDKGESWGKKAAKSMAYSVSASWIGIRDIVNAMVNGRDPSIGLLSTAYKTVTDAARDLNKDRPFSKQHAGTLLQHSATALGAVTGLVNAQVGKTGKFIYDYANGLEKPKGPWGWMVGARYGTLKNHSATFEQYMKGR